MVYLPTEATIVVYVGLVFHIIHKILISKIFRKKKKAFIHDQLNNSKQYQTIVKDSTPNNT